MAALSLNTTISGMAAEFAAKKSFAASSQAMTRLGTGYRINSAADDAAGLQIATRIKAASNGMAVALRNVQNGISLVQIADGAMAISSDLLIRMKELTLESMTGTSSDVEREALQAEYDSLGSQLWEQVWATSFGGERLFAKELLLPDGVPYRPIGGVFGNGPMTFQVGPTSGETIVVDFSTGSLLGLRQAYSPTSTKYASDTKGSEILTAGDAAMTLDALDLAIERTSTFRSDLGALGNRFESTANNLRHMKTQADVSLGRIMDTDYAVETANMTRSQMLSQVASSMVKESNSVRQLALSLLS